MLIIYDIICKIMYNIKCDVDIDYILIYCSVNFV